MSHYDRNGQKSFHEHKRFVITDISRLLIRKDREKHSVV